MDGAAFLDLVAEAVLDIQTESGGDLRTYHALLQTSGAIRRQMLKEHGMDHPILLCNQLVRRAYTGEIFRVISEWPESVDFIQMVRQ
jgi:hypothetical protein